MGCWTVVPYWMGSMAFSGHTTAVFSDEYERVKKERNLIICKHFGSS
jgi:hypothetical protein